MFAVLHIFRHFCPKKNRLLNPVDYCILFFCYFYFYNCNRNNDSLARYPTEYFGPIIPDFSLNHLRHEQRLESLYTLFLSSFTTFYPIYSLEIAKKKYICIKKLSLKWITRKTQNNASNKYIPENKTELNISINRTNAMFKNIYGGYIQNNICELKAYILEDFGEHLCSWADTHTCN